MLWSRTYLRSLILQFYNPYIFTHWWMKKDGNSGSCDLVKTDKFIEFLK